MNASAVMVFCVVVVDDGRALRSRLPLLEEEEVVVVVVVVQSGGGGGGGGGGGRQIA